MFLSFQARLDRINILEKQLAMSQVKINSLFFLYFNLINQNRNPTPDQLAHYQSIIEDLKSKLRQRDDSIQVNKIFNLNIYNTQLDKN